MNRKIINTFKNVATNNIQYSRIYHKITGSIKSAILLTQIIDIFTKHGDEFILIDSVLMEKSNLTINEYQTAKKKLKSLPFLQIQRKGLPPRTHYSIDWEAFQECIGSYELSNNSYCNLLEMSNSMETIETIPCLSKQNSKPSRAHNARTPAHTHDVRDLNNKQNRVILRNNNNKYYITHHHTQNKNKNLQKNNTTKTRLFETKSTPVQPKNQWEGITLILINSIPINRSKPPSVKTWSIQLRNFASHEKIPFPKIKKVLEWYASQFDRDKNPSYRKYLPEFVPQAISMSGFISKFYGIESAMLRNTKIEEPKLPSFKDLTKDQKTDYRSMKAELGTTTSWNKKTLPSLVLSLTVLQEGCYRYMDAIKLNDNIKVLYDNSIFTHRVMFISYAMWISHEIKEWHQWEGNLEIFKPGGKHFKRFMNDIIRQKGVSSEKIWEIINEASKG